MSRKIDALIAEKVFGHKVEHQIDGSEHDYYQNHWLEIDGEHHETWRLVPNYSTDIAAAWEVVEQLRNGKWCCIQFKADYSYTWTITLAESELSAGIGNHIHKCYYDGSAEFPMAVCIAALKSVGVPDDTIRTARKQEKAQQPGETGA